MIKELSTIYRERNHAEIADLLSVVADLAIKMGVPEAFDDLTPKQKEMFDVEAGTIQELDIPTDVRAPLERKGFNKISDARDLVRQFEKHGYQDMVRNFKTVRVKKLKAALEKYDADKASKNLPQQSE